MKLNDIIIWSGGFDSSYLVCYLIENQIIKDTCNLVSIETDVIGYNKLIREQNARKQILIYFKEKFPNIKFNHIIITSNVTANEVIDPQSSGLAQPIFWISNLIPYLKDNSNIYFGYIAGDDMVSYIHYCQQVFDLLCKFQWKKQLNVEFPLTVHHKSQILELLFLNYPELLTLCTSCENSFIDDNCGSCIPCKHHIVACLELLIKYKHNPTMHTKVKNYLKDYYNFDVSTINEAIAEEDYLKTNFIERNEN